MLLKRAEFAVFIIAATFQYLHAEGCFDGCFCYEGMLRIYLKKIIKLENYFEYNHKHRLQNVS